jgi:hypothetical protein
MRHKVFPELMGFVFLLSFSPLAKAQGELNRGVIEGLVTDPQGAVVAGVDVTIISLETNVTATTKTTSAGYYRVVDLVPGRYLGHFELAGFAPLDINGIQVLAGQVQRVDTGLQMGTTRQVVRVSAEVMALQTSPTNASTTVESRAIQDIPLSGRDMQQLVFLVPGVKSYGGPVGSLFGFNSQYGAFPDPTHVQGSNLSVNGGQGGANVWWLDGNYNISAMAQNMAVGPSPDSVDEFQAISNSFAAQYGGTGGGVFSVVLKSGANKVHGDIYDYLRNDALNARNPFTSIDAFGKIIKSRQIRYNDFGGTLSGPVVLPHIYDGKNKTFFFFSWDTSILHVLGQQTFDVPTAAMRAGDFSEDPNTATQGIWDPYSTVGPDAQGLFDRTAFGTPAAGNPNGCLASQVNASGGKSCNFATAIPANRFDPTAMFFMKSLPLPNYNNPLSTCPMAAGGYKICSNYLGAVGNFQDTNNMSIKIDEQWSQKSRYFFEWVFNPTNYGFYRAPWTGATFPQPQIGYNGNYPFASTSQIFGIGNTYTLSPTTINEFRVSFTRQYLTTHPDNPVPNSLSDQSQVQALMAASQIPPGASYPSPQFTVSGPGNYIWGPSAFNNVLNMAEAYTFLDNLTKVKGKHTITAGFMYRLEHTGANGQFPTLLNFGANAGNPVTGLGGGGGLATFMLGAVDNTSFTGNLASPYSRARTWGFYAQDEYRVTPSFTLSLGLRYDIFGWFKDRFPNDSNFCYTCANPLTGLPGEIVYTKGGLDIAPPSWKDLAPRFNFAWTPFKDKKTVLRGGFDVFYSNAAALQMAPGEGGPSQETGWYVESDWVQSWNPGQCASFTGQCVAFPLSDTTTAKGALAYPTLGTQFPSALKSPQLGYGGWSPVGWAGTGGTPHDPYVQMWQLEVQRELPGNLMFTIGYTGTYGVHLEGDHYRRMNYVPTDKILQLQQSYYGTAPITDYYSGQTAQALAQLYGTSSLPLRVLLAPYPFYGGINLMFALDGQTAYNGLNIKVQKRLSHGLSFGVAYTNSKQIDNCCVAQLLSNTLDSLHGSEGNATGGQTTVVGNVRGQIYQNPDNRKIDRALDRYDIPQALSIYGSYELPFGVGRSFLNQKGILNQVLGGWRLTGNFIGQAGIPLPISCPKDSLQSAIGNQVGGTTAKTGRCNLVGDPHFSGNRSKEQQIADWINPAAFEPSFGGDQNFWANYNPTDPRAWQFGNMGPVLPNMRSPGFWNLDSALTKNFPLSESKYFEFRWEAFNALNHMNPGYPNTNFCLPPTASGGTDLVHQAGCAFGRITNIQTDPRSMEFALKFYW